MPVERDEGYMKQHLVECFVDNNGEKTNVIWFGKPNLIPWPEIKILMELHGEQSVYDIRPVALGDREIALREKDRMIRKYGRDVVELVYAGKVFTMEWFMPGWPINPADAPKNKNTKSEGQNVRPGRVQFHTPSDTEATDARI